MIIIPAKRRAWQGPKECVCCPAPSTQPLARLDLSGDTAPAVSRAGPRLLAAGTMIKACKTDFSSGLRSLIGGRALAHSLGVSARAFRVIRIVLAHVLQFQRRLIPSTWAT
ncbi:hypothetical protein [Thiohalocapsa sp. ML1]|uniref:hypothetical protein n=1 Tax=Thiohalocapsa sp. ML1 TaxID=1431688 RepID=UPI0012E35DDD|nr:hypothetical protein [Thiohalocapsa sp. ML1]